MQRFLLLDILKLYSLSNRKQRILKDIPMKLKVREYLIERRIQQKDIAAQIGMSPSAFGKRIVSKQCNLEFLDTIAKILNASILDLIEDNSLQIVSSFEEDRTSYLILKKQKA